MVDKNVEYNINFFKAAQKQLKRGVCDDISKDEFKEFCKSQGKTDGSVEQFYKMMDKNKDGLTYEELFKYSRDYIDGHLFKDDRNEYKANEAWNKDHGLAKDDAAAKKGLKQYRTSKAQEEHVDAAKAKGIGDDELFDNEQEKKAYDNIKKHEAVEAKQGWAGQAWGGLKMAGRDAGVDIGTTYGDVYKQTHGDYHETTQTKDAEALKAKGLTEEHFEEVGQTIEHYEENQDNGAMGVKIVAGIGAAVALAPVAVAAGAAGASVAGGVGTTIGIGVVDAAIGIGIEGSDAISGGRDYTAGDAAISAATGFGVGVVLRPFFRYAGNAWRLVRGAADEAVPSLKAGNKKITVTPKTRSKVSVTASNKTFEPVINKNGLINWGKTVALSRSGAAQYASRITGIKVHDYGNFSDDELSIALYRLSEVAGKGDLTGIKHIVFGHGQGVGQAFNSMSNPKNWRFEGSGQSVMNWLYTNPQIKSGEHVAFVVCEQGASREFGTHLEWIDLVRG